jgi:hypothetical protein
MHLLHDHRLARGELAREGGEGVHGRRDLAQRRRHGLLLRLIHVRLVRGDGRGVSD